MITGRSWMLPSMLLFASVLAMARDVRYLECPAYPPMLRMGKLSGTVQLELEVDSVGRVLTAKALGHPNSYLKDAATKNVILWKFETSDKLRETIHVTYEYKLEGEPSYASRTRVRLHLPERVEVISNPPSP